MELKIDIVAKCDNCGGEAHYCISQKKKLIRSNITLCQRCFQTLYARMGSYITPQSPQPPFKKKKKENIIGESKT